MTDTDPPADIDTPADTDQQADAPARTVVVLSPHQDDEANRLCAFAVVAADRGDTLELLQATDGAATGVGPREGLSPQTLTRWRDREQTAYWDWVTDGRGTITRLGLPDGRADREWIRAALEARLSEAPGTPELYVATWHHDHPESHPADQHPDHVACVLAARDIRDASGLPVRFGRHAEHLDRAGTLYHAASPEQRLRVEGALASYSVIAQRSVPASYRRMLENGGSSLVTD